MSSVFDRLNSELETLGRKAQAALDEGRLRIELLRLRREQDRAAQELGRLFHRRERGSQVDPLQVDALLRQLDCVEAALVRVDREIASLKGEAVTVSEHPAPVSTPAAVAGEVVEGETGVGERK